MKDPGYVEKPREVSHICYQAAINALAQTKNLFRHYAALKIAYFKLLRKYPGFQIKLVNTAIDILGGNLEATI